jgi:phosphoserine phosphatase
MDYFKTQPRGFFTRAQHPVTSQVSISDQGCFYTHDVFGVSVFAQRKKERLMEVKIVSDIFKAGLEDK